jgi:hypothetical protein
MLSRMRRRDSTRSNVGALRPFVFVVVRNRATHDQDAQQQEYPSQLRVRQALRFLHTKPDADAGQDDDRRKQETILQHSRVVIVNAQAWNEIGKRLGQDPDKLLQGPGEKFDTNPKQKRKPHIPGCIRLSLHSNSSMRHEESTPTRTSMGEALDTHRRRKSRLTIGETSDIEWQPGTLPETLWPLMSDLVCSQ